MALDKSSTDRRYQILKWFQKICLKTYGFIDQVSRVQIKIKFFLLNLAHFFRLAPFRIVPISLLTTKRPFSCLHFKRIITVQWPLKKQNILPRYEKPISQVRESEIRTRRGEPSRKFTYGQIGRSTAIRGHSEIAYFTTENTSNLLTETQPPTPL